MKILCVCDQGVNRSVQFAHLLKYWGNDTIPIGLQTTSSETLETLYKWADAILLTENIQQLEIPQEYQEKCKLLDVGPDRYHRPFNSYLLSKAKRLIEENKEWLKNNG